MRKPFLLSATLASVMGAGGVAMIVFAPSPSVAQSASAPSVAAPAPLPPASQVPAETTAPGPGASAPANQSINRGAGASRMPSAGETRPKTGSDSANAPPPGAARSPHSEAAGQNTSIAAILTEARTAIDRRQTNRAEDALERAETAMLQRSVMGDQGTSPDSAPGVMHVAAARTALAKHDYATAKKAIAAAMPST